MTKEGKSPVPPLPPTSQTLWNLLLHELYGATQYHNQESYLDLIQQGADIHMIDTHGNTALLLAAFQGVPQVIKALVDAGSNVNHTNMHGRPPLSFAVAWNDEVSTQYLLDHGANPNIQDEHGTTPLMLAAMEAHHINIVHLLLRKGADIKLKDQNGMTALDHAIDRNNSAAAHVLEAEDRRRTTIAFTTAAKKGTPKARKIVRPRRPGTF